MSAVLFGRSTEYPSVTVEFGFSTVSSSSSTWSAGVWNTSKWSGIDVVWTDVTAYVRSINTNRERNRDIDAYPAGTATIVLSNIDARFTPANTSGPYTAAGVTKIVPKVPVRVRATWAGVTYGVFFGRVNSWQDDYPGAGKDSVTTVSCADVMADLVPVQLATLVASIGASDYAGARISRILSAAGWRWGTDISNGGFITMPATTLGGAAWDFVDSTSDADGGDVFADQDGALVFQDSYYPTGARSSRASTVQIAFGAGAGQVAFGDPSLTYDDTLIYNESIVTRAGGTAQTSTNADSIALYGRRTISRSNLLVETDAQSKQRADFDIMRFKEPEYRVAGLTVLPAASPSSNWPLVLSSRFGDYCTATVVTPSALTVTRDVFVSGISHSISASGWSVRYSFTSATPFKGTWGGWDGGLWDTVTFFA